MLIYPSSLTGKTLHSNNSGSVLAYQKLVNYFQLLMNYLKKPLTQLILLSVKIDKTLYPLPFFWRFQKQLRNALIKYFNFDYFIEFTIRDQIKIYGNLKDYSILYLYLHDTYEPSTTSLIKSILNPGDNFIDIGSNIGYFSLIASK